MQKITESSVPTAINQLVETVRANDVQALGLILKSYLPCEVSNGLIDTEECLRFLKQQFARLEELRILSSVDGDQDVNHFFHKFIYPLIVNARQQETQSADILLQSVTTVNNALECKEPLVTLTALRPFLREHTLKSLNMHKAQGSLSLIAALYHIELGAAKTDKGSPLTHEELLAASDVLACVVKLNEAIDKHDPHAVYNALLIPDAFWDHVHQEPLAGDRDKWARFYFQRLCKFRDQKSMTGRIPILTHAEIQAIVDQCKSVQLTHSVTTRNLNKTQVSTTFGCNDGDAAGPRSNSLARSPSSSFNPIDHLVTNLSRNSPNLTFESIRALQRARLINLPFVDSSLADIYHSFLDFYWQNWSAQSINRQMTAKPDTKLFPLTAVCQAIECAHRLVTRMRELGVVLTQTNQALDRDRLDDLVRCLNHPLMHTEGNASPINGCDNNTQQNASAQQFSDVFVNYDYHETYHNALRQLRVSRISNYLHQSKAPGQLLFAEQPRLSLAEAYLGAICPSVLGCGWLWTYTRAISEHDILCLSPVDQFDCQALTRLKVPFFYNVHTGDMIRWPITSFFSPTKSIWTENLCELRWPISVKQPPPLDPSLVSREDCILTVMRINKLIDLKPYKLNSMFVAPVIDSFDWCQAIETMETSEMPVRLYGCRSQQMNQVVSSIVLIQAYWRGYRARKQYRARLQLFTSAIAQTAAVCLQKHWRRVMVQRETARLLVEHRKRVFEIIRLQSAWRGRQTRWFYHRLKSLAVNRLFTSSNEDELRSKSPTFQSHAENAFNCLSRYIHCLDGQAAKAAYEQEMQGYLLGKRVASIIERLDEVNKELISSDQLIKLLVGVRLKGRTVPFQNDHSIETISTANPSKLMLKKYEKQTTGHNADNFELPEDMIRLYGQLCYLCYTQPEYVASLLYEISNASLWKFSVIPRTSGFCHFRPNVYGLSIERLIFGLYRYGSSTADEARLQHLFVRCLHKEIHRLRLFGNSQRWFAEQEPWPLVLRLIVSMARIKTFHSQHHHQHHEEQQKQQKTKPQYHPQGQQQQQEQQQKRKCTTNSEFDDFQTHTALLKHLLVQLVQTIQRAEIIKSNNLIMSSFSCSTKCSQYESIHSKRETESVLTSQCPLNDGIQFLQNNRSMVVDCSTARAGISYAPHSSLSQSNRHSLTGVDSCLQQMLNAAGEFFYGIFVQPGAAALPKCLVRMMRELFAALRQTFPDQAEKIHLKFVGHCLLHRYFHSCIIAPDIFFSTYASIQSDRLIGKHETPLDRDRKSSDSLRRGARGDSKHTTVTEAVKMPPTKDVSYQTRRTLAAVSRLLYFVIANKGYGSSKRSDQTVSTALSSLLNPLIRKWHVLFRTFLLNLVQTKPHSAVSTLPQMECIDTTAPIATWISDTPDTDVDLRLTTAEKEFKNVGTHHVILSAEELFEFHRLLNLHRQAIAPHPTDVLHILLNALGSAPTTLVPQRIEGDTVSEKISKTDESTTEDINPEEDEEIIDISSSLTTYESHELSSASNPNIRSTVDKNTHTSKCHQSESIALKLFSRKIHTSYRVFWPQPRSSASREHVIQGSQQIVLSLIPTSLSTVIQARLYAAFATQLTATDCISLPMRQCHPSPVRFQVEPDDGFNKCIFCVATQDLELYNFTASLVLSGATGPVNPILQRSFSSVRSTEEKEKCTGKLDLGRPVTAHDFQLKTDDSPSTSSSQYTKRTYVTFDWLEARRVLIELFKHVRNIGLQSSSGLPVDIEKCPNIRAWIQRLDEWVLSKAKEYIKTPVSDADSLDISPPTTLSQPDSTCFTIEKQDPSIKQLSSLLNKFKQISNRLVTLGFLQEKDGYHDLLVALARDIFHLRSPCRQRHWECVINNIQTIEDHVNRELQMLDQQATVYAAHALDCLIPLHRTYYSPWDSRWAAHRFRSRSSFQIKISANRLRKYGLISCDQSKWQNNLQMFIEPSIEGVSRFNERKLPIRSDRLFQVDRSNAHTGLRFVPGMFDIRVELSGMLVHKRTVSLVDLLCQHHRGIEHLPIMNNFYLVIHSLIQLLLDSYYTVH